MKVQTISSLTHFGTRIFPNPSYFWLRSFLDQQHPTNEVEWMPPIFDSSQYESIVTSIQQNQVTHVLFTIHFWNEEHCKTLGTRLAQELPHVTLLGGGPMIDTRHISLNWTTYPWLDCLFYGEGEEAWVEAVRRWERTGQIGAGLNCATRDDQGWYKRFRYEDWSPYEHYTGTLWEEFRDTTLTLNETYNKTVYWAWETVRGCPYGCTFCDWNFGLHNKVSLRDLDTSLQELDRIYSHNQLASCVVMVLTDANFMQIARDQQILEHVVERNYPIKITNWSKTLKHRVYPAIQELNKRSVEIEDQRVKASLQSIKPEALQGIARPEMPWPEHKKLIQQSSGETRFEAELIAEMPTMTIRDYVWQLLELEEAGIAFASFYLWDWLPNSPAGTQEYRQQWGYEKVLTLNLVTPLQIDSLEQTLTAVSKNDGQNVLTGYTLWLKGQLYESVFSHILAWYYNWLKKRNLNFCDYIEGDIQRLSVLARLCAKRVEEQEKIAKIRVWGIWKPTSCTIEPLKSYCELLWNNKMLKRGPEDEAMADLEEIKQLIQQYKDRSLNQWVTEIKAVS